MAGVRTILAALCMFAIGIASACDSPGGGGSGLPSSDVPSGSDNTPADVPVAETADTGPAVDTSGPPTFSSFAPEDGVAKNVFVAVYSVVPRELVTSTTLDTEGPFTVSVDEAEPGGSYLVYATADGYYTELAYASLDDTLDIDLDAVGEHPGGFAGVLIGMESFSGDQYLPNAEVSVIQNGATVGTVNTDNQGRFGFVGAAKGAMTLSFNAGGMTQTMNISKSANQEYQDLAVNMPSMEDKPNIYLYPPATTRVSVELGFPNGGHVVVSDPPYGTGWDVTITPDGTIDGKHGYLFYESLAPCPFEAGTGWLVSATTLTDDLAGILAGYGFVGREIADFLAYWVPRFQTSDLYAVHPAVDEEVDDVVSLAIEPPPDVVRRLLLRVRALDHPTNLVTPQPRSFERRGFSVLEWGVVQDR